MLLARGIPHSGRYQHSGLPPARSRQSNNGALPVTLLWYPKLRDSIGFSDPLWAVWNASLAPGEGPQSTFNRYDFDLESVESLEDIFTCRDPLRRLQQQQQEVLWPQLFLTWRTSVKSRRPS